MAEDIEGGIGLLLMLALVGWGLSALLGGEREGIAKYHDCREIITLKSDNYKKYYMEFTCDYIRSNTGKIMGGKCVHIDTNNSFLSSGNSCIKAFVYEKSPEIKCSDTINGFLGSDDKCYCFSGAKFNWKTNKCE